jgi:hypothetical protein
MYELANMKKLVVIAILILAVSLVFAGCKKQTGEETALQQKLLGHWSNTDAGDIYFSKDRMIVTTNGKTYTLGYRVISGDEFYRSIVLRTDRKVSDENLETISNNNEVSITLAKDGKSIQESNVVFKKSPAEVTFTRVDAAESP